MSVYSHHELTSVCAINIMARLWSQFFTNCANCANSSPLVEKSSPSYALYVYESHECIHLSYMVLMLLVHVRTIHFTFVLPEIYYSAFCRHIRALIVSMNTDTHTDTTDISIIQFNLRDWSGFIHL